MWRDSIKVICNLVLFDSVEYCSAGRNFWSVFSDLSVLQPLFVNGTVCVFACYTAVALPCCRARGELCLNRTHSLPWDHGFWSVRGQKSSCSHFSRPSVSRTSAKWSSCSDAYTHTSAPQTHTCAGHTHCRTALWRRAHSPLISWTTSCTISLAVVCTVTLSYKDNIHAHKVYDVIGTFHEMCAILYYYIYLPYLYIP